MLGDCPLLSLSMPHPRPRSWAGSCSVTVLDTWPDRLLLEDDSK